MKDDMQGLYGSASEAYYAGVRSGRDEFFRTAIGILGAISAKQESGPVNGPEAKVATRGFHVAQDCCKAVRDVREALDKPPLKSW